MEQTTDPRVTAIQNHNKTLKFVGAGTIADILDAAQATGALSIKHDAPSTGSIPTFHPVLVGAAA
ncbi:hypothetical protein [Pseudarthrobacter sp. BIM B-2242]|uniref:hypothetical protein n=1 Tax=Pseudarthrobacter sp. BIM B-2242 TaxID=2772401 RepID=UPI00168C049A|nr:hypothetical protein [Pseudarthrobacter sp. BIM B-2242]QOD06014.1 hypothetical protein IDT60_20840 [Pseudarthrobacter sp. BIM B-2242]